jgi:hypothetical protein
VPDRPRILCISLSPLRSDARVLREIGVLTEVGDVTTVGFGAAPEGVDDHIRVPDGLPTLPQTPLGVLNLALRRWRASELAAPAVRFARDALGDRRFDLVVANEARALGLAHHVAQGAPVWADMHEWAPEERTHILSWRLLVAPLMTHLCRTYLPRSAAVSAVCDSIADLYDATFGVRTRVIRNSGAWRDLPVHPVGEGIRLVHSGAAVHGRSLELMIDAVRELPERFTLDLYLMPGGDGGAYLASLRARARGEARIRFCDPVAPGALPETLNAYDVGVFWIPPTHTNARYTLPNKFFDYVQARLAVAIGPTVEMARLTERFGLGVISDGFTLEHCVASLRDLDPAAIERAKRNAAAASHELSFETDGAVMRELLADVLGSA